MRCDRRGYIEQINHVHTHLLLEGRAESLGLIVEAAVDELRELVRERVLGLLIHGDLRI